MPMADSDPTLVLFAPGAEENTIAPLPNCIAGCAAAIGNDNIASSMESTMSGNAMRMTFFLFMDGTFLLGYLIICSVYDFRSDRTRYEGHFACCECPTACPSYSELMPYIIIYPNEENFNRFYTKKRANLQIGHNILWYDGEKCIISVIFLEIIL